MINNAIIFLILLKSQKTRGVVFCQSANFCKSSLTAGLCAKSWTRWRIILKLFCIWCQYRFIFALFIPSAMGVGRIFSKGATRGFFQNLSRGAKSGENCCFPLETKKTTFFRWNFQNRGALPPFRRPCFQLWWTHTWAKISHDFPVPKCRKVLI